MLEVVQVVIIGQSVAQIAADGVIDLGGAGVVLLHQSLHHFQLLGRGELLVQLDTGAGGQLDDGVLGEVLHAAADIAGPLVHHGVGGGVHGHESQLVEPAGDAAFLVHVAHGLAGAHGDAQYVVVLQAHGAGQGGHVTVVGHGVGHVAKGVLHGADVDVLDLLVEVVLGHLQEQGGAHGTVVDVHAGGGDTHGVHPGHMLGGGLESGHDDVIVIVGVSSNFGEPDDLLGEDGLTVDDGGHLAVRATRVKADAAAVQMAAHGDGLIQRLGNVLGVDHLEGLFKHVGHEVPVKGAGTLGAVGGLQILIHLLVVDIDLIAALHPQLGLDQTVNVVAVGLVHLGGAVNKGVVGGHLLIGTLYGDGDGLFRRGQKSTVEVEQGNKLGVENGGVFDLNRNTISFHGTSSYFLINGNIVRE